MTKPKPIPPLTLDKFQEGLTTPLHKLSKLDLLQREEFWRALWSWIPDEVKYYVYRIGSIVRVYLRTYRGTMGELGAVKFAPTELELFVYEKHYDESKGKYFYETKTLKIPYVQLLYLEVIHESEEVDTVNVPEVESIPELSETEVL